ncbi:MAG: hypothetical protein HY070_09340 [Chloroflexi bacterium]|nr:hypothetical protein [Chloroflexota bacterium]
MKLFARPKYFAIALALFTLTLACRTSDVMIAQFAPTATATRARPTLTPTLTQTPEPTATITRTRAPTARPTARPPTAPPAPPPVVSTFPYIYHAQFQKCEHAGDTYIKGTVYRDRNDPNSIVIGAIVVFSGSPDGAPAEVQIMKEQSYTFILQAHGASPGNFFVWVVDPSLKRISEISPIITFNNKPASDPTSCWAAVVDFWKEPGK